ncbi:hypothetical protein PFICI_00904 [Pestalotiopsis fici W106-1]|uniref:Uncharacterized protein n=1 Tax=Pestalotiopsis fici (strain W106-1 / CGMCC3.15140) TaxID=1229662 RepID=W3XP78_PESFW|nr:uncharacterized protein PFICI_00904 [Pestalotiopsis fici W106-1]ETS87076.1 hypothetical protein PFICI_00904 [Pestalotiopsis fici W106-1]
MGLSDPNVWAAIQRTLAQQNRLSLIAPNEASPKKAGVIRRPEVPSRTSSQRRALDHFARELEKYADAADATGKLPVTTPTESDMKYSLHTVKPLFPYKKEFEAAGLAMTADQQRNKSPEQIYEQSHGKCAASNCRGQEPHEGIDGIYDYSSDSATPSSQWVVEFPQPNPISTKDETLPARKEARQTVGKDSPIRGRKMLPWLRRKHGTMEPDTTPRGRVGTMIETRRGEWRLTGKENEQPKKAPPVTTGIRPRQEAQKSRQLKSVDPVAPQTPAKSRPHVVRSHMAEFINGSSNPPTRAEEKKTDRKNQFRPEKELARGSLPRVRSSRHDQDLDSRPHHHPFFQRHHHSPHHRIHHVHGAPVTWVEEEPKKSPKRRLDESQGIRKPKPRPKPVSPAPELPYTWKYAVSNASSLERALNMAQERVSRIESQALRPSNPVVPKAKSHKHHPLLAQDSCRNYIGSGQPLKPVEAVVTTEEVKTGTAFGQNTSHLQRQYPLARTENRMAKQEKDNVAVPLPTQQTEYDVNDQRDTKRFEYPPLQHGTKPENQSIAAKGKEKMHIQEIGEMEEAEPLPSSNSPDDLDAVLDYLDVFFDTDDAAIDDLVVLQGLQVAVKAAADDLYDGLLRQRTGLRIRRFLADLKAIDAFDPQLAVNQPMPKPSASKRLKRGQPVPKT